MAQVTRKTLRRLSYGLADLSEAGELAALRNRVAERLTEEHGGGHWSNYCTDRGVASGFRASKLLVARDDNGIIATLRLTSKKPWAIDRKYFTPGRRPVYLVDMAVDPEYQRRGVGTRLLEEARAAVAAWPGDAIWLDAYDASAGAGDFYRRSGFREVGRASYRATPLIYFEFLLER